MTNIIDGKAVAQKIKDQVKNEIKENNLDPGLAVVLVGDNQASQVYVKNKKKACEYAGIKSFSFNLPKETDEEELLKLIEKLNKDKAIDGILVQLPLPKHINSTKILLAINPDKDVDGFHPVNVGKLYTGAKGLKPCTPAGIIELLKNYNIKISGKHAVVLGRSNIVGKPVAQMLLENNATVTICHSRTKALEKITKKADILIAAIGKAKFVKKEMLKKYVIVVDVGMNRDENNKLCGDVDYEQVKKVSSYITPVPGGVGPMTIAMLIKNCLEAHKNLH
ncbi:bifunctional methylenetetrahydrofolate dehydrogenase/methenyltetrahydrofolate cyclohydrolase FolD [Candidatus Parcubacteria bacterium]|mgnify:CR=1 FL=1|nr:MAG: bifunctional methylenetetrahydrofolate dehydrogenase/methenyltetrahydrofolate cyclohydrolase FolD [Candidatus Parcubacteria bacterium]